MKNRPTQLLAMVLILQLVLCFTFFFRIPVAQQVIGFLYLTFIPGFVAIRLLKLDNLGTIKILLFSVGLSISFLMLIGLAMNELGPIAGIVRPLEPMPMTLATSCLVLLEAVLCYFRNSRNDSARKLTTRALLELLLLAILPLLSVIGAVWANVSGSTSILLLTLVATIAVFVLAVFSGKLVAPRLYPVVIFVVAISLLFHHSLISSYIYGADIHIEYSQFTLTQRDCHWNSTAYYSDPIYGTYNTMLSLTILPTIYSNLLNLDPTWILKIVFPLIFAFVPVALYVMWQEKLGAMFALFSAFLLMSQITFYSEMLGLARQMIAELFFALLFVILLSKEFSPKNLKILFAIFSFSLVVSHYSLAILFFSFILIMWISTYLTKRRTRHLSMSLIMLFFALMFSWYIYTSASVSFESIMWFGDWIYRGLGSFFNPASRGEGVLRGIGMEQTQSYLQSVSRIVAYATQFFIAIGFLELTVHRKKKEFDFEYLILCFGSMIILAMCILLPNFAMSLQMSRFYHILLFFLASLFSIGCLFFLEFTTNTKRKLYSSVLITALLVTYFLFQTNFMYEVTGSQSWSLPLSRYRLGSRLHTEFGYVTTQEVTSAQWLSKHADTGDLVVYSDWHTFSVLVSYGSIYREKLRALTNTTAIEAGEFVYLGELNTVYGIVVEIGESNSWNILDVLGLQSLDTIYTNGNSEICRNVNAFP